MSMIEFEDGNNRDFEEEVEGCCASEIDWCSIITAALVGGVVSGFACFFYNHVLSDKQRKEIKDAIVSKARPAVAKLIAGNPHNSCEEEDDLY